MSEIREGNKEVDDAVEQSKEGIQEAIDATKVLSKEEIDALKEERISLLMVTHRDGAQNNRLDEILVELGEKKK